MATTRTVGGARRCSRTHTAGRFAVFIASATRAVVGGPKQRRFGSAATRRIHRSVERVRSLESARRGHAPAEREPQPSAHRPRSRGGNFAAGGRRGGPNETYVPELAGTA